VEARIDNQTGFVANDQALVRPVGMVNIIPFVQELPTMVAHSHNLQRLPPPNTSSLSLANMLSSRQHLFISLESGRKTPKNRPRFVPSTLT